MSKIVWHFYDYIQIIENTIPLFSSKKLLMFLLKQFKIFHFISFNKNMINTSTTSFLHSLKLEPLKPSIGHVGT